MQDVERNDDRNSLWEGWTDDAIARCKIMWFENKAASAIGSELGATRNMIIAKMNRLGYSKRALGEAAAAGLPPEAAPQFLPKRKRVGLRSKGIRVVKDVASPPPPEPPTPPRGVLAALDAAFDSKDNAPGVPFLIAKDNQCKFPLWDSHITQSVFDKRYCGCPRVGTLSWCAKHLAVVSEPHRAKRIRV